MPLYEYKCPDHGQFDQVAPMKDYLKPQPCPTCSQPSVKLISVPVVYGTMKLHDKVMADASEASGEEITNTKQIDALEKAGKMYAITNPSRARKFKEKK